jgi:transposase
LPPDNHRCDWREYALQLQADIELLKTEVAALKRGHRSEKLPPMSREVRRGRPIDPTETRRKRKERAIAKTRLQTERVEIKVPDDQRSCPACGNDRLKPVGDGKPSTRIDYVAGYFRRRVFQRETLACRCGDYIVSAPAPDRSTDKTRYGPGFIAHLIVSKIADSIPLYRLEKQYRRLGIDIARSTMTDLFHRNAELLAPLAARLVELIRQAPVVLADETSIKMLGAVKRAYLWTFIAGALIAYRFSADRSGQTPSQVLGGTQGSLVVDAFTGYNAVTRVDGRKRSGCLAHARRKVFDAQEGVPEAREALEMIRDVYVVEHEAKERGIVGTAEHLRMRQERSRLIMDKLKTWLVQHQGLHPPKSKMGRAVGYALKQWTALTRFLDDAAIPPDNNRSESALRVVALGRKNYLFVGNEDAGDNIAGLYSLVATCEANGVNPIAYLTDVLLRVSTHPADQIDDLLPQNWRITEPAAA